MNHTLKCFVCGKKYDPQERSLYECEKCGGSVKIIYNYEKVASTINIKTLEKRKGGLWKYKELLPVSDNSKTVTLGEGGTELHQCKRLARIIGVKRLYAKDETRNPTGTFKDRAATVGVSKALELGAKAIVIASDGNAGPATAAYAAKAGLRCCVFMPVITPIERIIQAQVYGAEVILVEGTVNDCIDVATEVGKHYAWHQLTTAIPLNPYQGEGSKTIAYEICEDLGWRVPDWVIVPVGGGGLLSANWKGFQEFFNLGLINKLPRIAGIQAEGCAPLVKAYEESRKPDEIENWGKPETLAITIGVPFPLDGATALTAIRKSKGAAVRVSDKEILRAERLLAENEGIFAEPAGAASLAGLMRLLEKGIIGKDEIIVFEVTGTGLKDLNSAIKTYEKPPCIKIKSKEVENVIKFLKK